MGEMLIGKRVGELDVDRCKSENQMLNYDGKLNGVGFYRSKKMEECAAFILGLRGCPSVREGGVHRD